MCTLPLPFSRWNNENIAEAENIISVGLFFSLNVKESKLFLRLIDHDTRLFQMSDERAIQTRAEIRAKEISFHFTSLCRPVRKLCQFKVASAQRIFSRVLLSKWATTWLLSDCPCLNRDNELYSLSASTVEHTIKQSSQLSRGEALDFEKNFR